MLRLERGFQMKFQIKKKSKNVLETIIKTTEIENEFTVAEFLEGERQNKKSLIEIEGMMRMEKAKMKNVGDNHPKVLKLDEKILIGAYIYYQSLASVRQGKAKIRELNKALKQTTKDKKDIEKQTSFDFKQFEPKK